MGGCAPVAGICTKVALVKLDFDDRWPIVEKNVDIHRTRAWAADVDIDSVRAGDGVPDQFVMWSDVLPKVRQVEFSIVQADASSLRPIALRLKVSDDNLPQVEQPQSIEFPLSLWVSAKDNIVELAPGITASLDGSQERPKLIVAFWSEDGQSLVESFAIDVKVASKADGSIFRKVVLEHNRPDEAFETLVFKDSPAGNLLREIALAGPSV